MTECELKFQVIAPMLIVLRVAQGSAWTQETISSSTNIEFDTRAASGRSARNPRELESFSSCDALPEADFEIPFVGLDRLPVALGPVPGRSGVLLCGVPVEPVGVQVHEFGACRGCARGCARAVLGPRIRGLGGTVGPVPKVPQQAFSGLLHAPGRPEAFFDRDKASVKNYTGRGGALQRYLPMKHFRCRRAPAKMPKR